MIPTPHSIAEFFPNRECYTVGLCDSHRAVGSLSAVCCLPACLVGWLAVDDDDDDADPNIVLFILGRLTRKYVRV